MKNFSLAHLSIPLVAGLASYFVTAIVRTPSLAGRLMDIPNERSSHSRSTPRGGGVGLVLVTLLGGLIASFFVSSTPVSLLLGGLFIAILGFWDDASSLPAKTRLVVQVLCALLITVSSNITGSVSIGWLPLSISSLVVGTICVFFVVGLTNAYNFMDGIDGIAGLQGVVAGLGWAALGWYSSDPVFLIMGALIAASCAGFLGHNWHPARIFMGDVGSTFLGYIFAGLTVLAAAKSPTLGLAGVILVYPFIFDSLLTFFHRVVRRQPLLQPHRKHLFQRLVVAGLSHSVVASFYGLLAALGAVVAYKVASGHPSDLSVLIVVPAAGICLCLTVAGTTGSLHALLGSLNLSQRVFRQWINRFENITNVNRVGTWAVQAAVFAVSGYVAFALRFDLSIPEPYNSILPLAVVIWVVVKSIVFRLHGLDRGWWHLISVHDIVLLAAGNLTGSLCAMVFVDAVLDTGLPKSIVLIDFLLTFLATTGIRLATRISYELLVEVRHSKSVKRVLIYGAGTMGANLLREIRSNPKLPFQVVGFVDDDPRRHGLVIQGARILGGCEDLAGLVEKHGAEEVLIALVSADGPSMSRIIKGCATSSVRCRTVPPMQDIIGNRKLTSQIRDVAVEDLLGRTPVRLDEDSIRHKLEDEIVLVTGAAGSIGSELCRQIARFRPKLLIGFDIAETGLYHLEREMRTRFPDVAFTPAIGSIQNWERLRDLFSEYRPRVVYHAAAYKHVPLMEEHIVEAVENNVFGTWNLATAAADFGVTDFVMISSDKAVHPTNIMGATKRIAELVVRSMSACPTRFTSVRFGNVLGSNGSVVPLFKSQIAEGGPVTITHPDMERYFMTIPEASQLVLQASTMGKGGEIFVLEMGQPVKIVDLARNLIQLSGLQPDIDIKIEITGARPGEKLYEEISLLNESTVPSEHPKIKVFQSPLVDQYDMTRHLEALRGCVNSGSDFDLLARILRIVPEYKASRFVRDRTISNAKRSATA